MELEYKRVPFAVKEVVPVADGGWEISGYASTWGGQPDAYGDIVARGAFADSIAARPTKFLYEHFEPIGKQLEILEDDLGLFGRWTIVDTTRGTDAYKLAKGGVLDSLSIGFIPVESDYREDGVRVLRKCDLYEVSCVAIPANTNAVITAVKSRPFADHTSAVRIAVEEWLERIKSGSDIRQKDGREPITEARRSVMTQMSGSLRSAADELVALLEPPSPPERLDIGMELRRRRYARNGFPIGATPCP